MHMPAIWGCNELDLCCYFVWDGLILKLVGRGESTRKCVKWVEHKWKELMSLSVDLAVRELAKCQRMAWMRLRHATEL
jgi:hypothetical protein